MTAQTAAARGAAEAEMSRSAPRALAEEAAGAAAAQQGGYEVAEGHFRAAIRIDPQLESVYLNLGRLYQEHANEHPDAARKALATYRALLKVAPSNTEGLYQAGYLAACAGEWSASRAWLERLPADARSRPQVLAVLAIDFAALAEPRRASETAMALLAHPDLTEADVLAAGPALERANNAALEEQLLVGLDARGLTSAASLRRLGAVEMRLGRLEAARAALERAAAASPAPSVPLLLDLARVAYKQKDYDGVLGYLAHARELEPDNAEVHFFFGIASIELNLGSEAYDALKKAVALSPDNPYVNYALGAVAIHRHEPSEALPYFERVRPAQARRPTWSLRAGGREVLQPRLRRRPRRPDACGAGAGDRGGRALFPRADRPSIGPTRRGGPGDPALARGATTISGCARGAGSAADSTRRVCGGGALAHAGADARAGQLRRNRQSGDLVCAHARSATRSAGSPPR